MQLKTKKAQTIYDLLEQIQKRPGFYLGSRTLSSLRDFLSGFSVGQQFTEHAQDGEPPFTDFSAWFCIHHRAPRAGAGGWYGAIMDELLDDKKAFDRFFEHLATYRQRALELQWKIPLTPAQRRLYSTAQRSPAPHHLHLARYRGERCLFLYARGHRKRSWYLHTGFESLTQSHRWLEKVFGVTKAQWKKATHESA